MLIQIILLATEVPFIDMGSDEMLIDLSLL